MIGQIILNPNLRVHLNPNFRESGLHTYIHIQRLGMNLLQHYSYIPGIHAKSVWYK